MSFFLSRAMGLKGGIADMCDVNWSSGMRLQGLAVDSNYTLVNVIYPKTDTRRAFTT